MDRYLVLFAREPAREAREKGFAVGEAAELFARFGAEWLAAARLASARLVVATPPEDRAAWRRHFRDHPDLIWISQDGSRFGQRLERTARRISALGGHTIFVGGDVPASSEKLIRAFEALERGADAVLGPAEDGGVSLIALRPDDLDLLGSVAPRRRDVFSMLERRLESRARRVTIVSLTPDVDGRRHLRALLRAPGLLRDLARLARRVLSFVAFGQAQTPRAARTVLLHDPPLLRGPPLPG